MLHPIGNRAASTLHQVVQVKRIDHLPASGRFGQIKGENYSLESEGVPIRLK